MKQTKNNSKIWGIVIIIIITLTALSISSENSHFSGSYTASFGSFSIGVCGNDSGEISAVKSYLMSSVLNDTDSYRPIDWSKVSMTSDSTYQLTHTFNARNAYGAYEVKTMVFVVSKDRLRILKHYTLY